MLRLTVSLGSTLVCAAAGGDVAASVVSDTEIDSASTVSTSSNLVGKNRQLDMHTAPFVDRDTGVAPLPQIYPALAAPLLGLDLRAHTLLTAPAAGVAAGPPDS
jgi:hypothetical protein